MKFRLLNMGFIFMIAGCSIHRERNASNYLDFYGSDTYSPEVHKFESAFKNLKDRRVLYTNSYIGNFTLYYSPDILDADTVMVPHVSCYSASLDFPDENVEEHKNHNKCRYYEVVRYYSDKPEYFFEIEGKIDLDLAKKIAKYWYENANKRRHIDYISQSGANISISISGDGCLRGMDVEIDPGTKQIEFKEREI
jgi:hypothetical protein